MPDIDVHVRFENPADRDAAVAKLSALTLPDGTFVEDSEDDHFLLSSASGDAAMARASVILRGALDGTDIDPATASLSAGLGWFDSPH